MHLAALEGLIQKQLAAGQGRLLFSQKLEGRAANATED